MTLRARAPWQALPVAIALLATSPLVLGEPAPGAVAIRDARIVPVSAPVIDRGTIVIAKGLIKAVGKDVAIPPGAWVIDGKGLTVYPGLIDALSDLGLTTTSPPASGGGAAAPSQPGPPRPTTSAPQVRGPEDRPASTPWVQAADELKPDDRRFEAWRASGFTTTLTAPKSGIFPGQGAVINLAGERAGDLVVHAPASLQVSFQTAGGFRSFPGSLMGVIAYVRQVFLDAEQDAAARSAYEAAPRGLDRPQYDRTVRAIQNAQAARLPVVMPASTPAQIERAIDLAEELKLRPVLVNVHHGYRVADRIASAKAPVIVSLKWPDRDPNADPEADETLRSLQLRAGAPSTPAALHKHGVRFAFSSDGVPGNDLLKHVRKAIDAGLSEDAALRALTLDAAEILGVSNRLGSLETDKIANLVVADGDLFAEKTKIRMTFIDGEKFETREPSRPTEKPTTTLTGKWTLSVTTPQGAQTVTADLEMAEDGTLSGTVSAPLGSAPVANGWVSGSKFSFEATVPMGEQPVTFTFSGSVEGSSIKGTMSSSRFSGDFTGTRPTASGAGR
jgi:imidazolonepropionase-like amidohydrolase